MKKPFSCLLPIVCLSILTAFPAPAAQIDAAHLAELRARSAASTKELIAKMEKAAEDARARINALPKDFFEELAAKKSLAQGKLGIAQSGGGAAA